MIFNPDKPGPYVGAGQPKITQDGRDGDEELGYIVDITDKTYTIQIIGDTKQINALVELLKPIGIKEFVRSGKVAMSKSASI